MMMGTQTTPPAVRVRSRLGARIVPAVEDDEAGCEVVAVAQHEPGERFEIPAPLRE